MMTATKTHREMCQEDWIIQYQGADVFSEYAPLNGTVSEQKWGQPLAKSAESIEELFLPERFIFRDYVIQPCSLDTYIVNVGNAVCSFMTMLYNM